MNTKSLLALAGMAMALPMGCATSNDAPQDPAAMMIERMDAAPPEERVPHWDTIRARMVRPAPAVGDVAPPFTLETMDGSQTIALAEFQPTKPVVLVFGSWT